MKKKPVKKSKQPSAYSRNTLAWLRRECMKIEKVTSVCHLYPRAYCIAKPAPGCAVLVTPWIDSEEQVRNETFSASHIVHDNVTDIKAGDWCAMAYVVKSTGCSHMVCIPLEETT